MQLSSLKETAASDAAFLYKKDSGITCRFRLYQRRLNQTPL